MTDKKSLKVIGEPTNSENEYLPAPFSKEDLRYLRVKRGYPAEPNMAHTYIKDGIAVKGLDFTKPENFNLLKNLLNTSLEAINSVEDEHFKELGLISAGFLRFLELGFAPKPCKDKARPSCDKQLHIEVNLYFRFTTDLCPAGLRMMSKAKSETSKAVINLLKCKPNNLNINYIHGGSPWDIMDIHDQTQREIMLAILEVIERQPLSA